MQELRERFQLIYPKAFFLSDSINALSEYLKGKNWLHSGEHIQSVEKPGEGNMNCVFRIITNERSFIIKQARPWVEKYPQIEAPVERNEIEGNYFSLINKDEILRKFSPELLGIDKDSFVLLMSDLGNGADYAHLYQKNQTISELELEGIIRYLSQLHILENPTFSENKAMRALNHFHIFTFPFLEENDFNLDDIQEGLQVLSLPYKKNEALKSRIAELGNRYLSTGNHLIHGDYYPGSWLQTSKGLKIIDPEFSFKGPKEFDMGVLIAHLMMAQQGKKLIEKAIIQYETNHAINHNIFAGFAGTEILRRLFGVAQLPLILSINEKKNLAQMAANWILEGKLVL